jgi:hypothetical protein
MNLPSLDEQADAIEALRALTARLNRVRAKREAALRTLVRYETVMVNRAFDGALVRPTEGDESPSVIRDRLLSAPRPTTAAAPRREKLVKSLPTLDDLLLSWPPAGQTFEQLQTVLHADYDVARTLVFEALEKGIITQRFDANARAMMLVKQL